MSPNAPPSDLRLKPPNGAVWELVGDQMVVAIRSARRPIVLDPVASAVWPLLATGVSPRDASAWLVDQRGIEQASAVGSTLVLVEQLLAAGFLLAGQQDQLELDRLFRAAISPCDAAPYLKGPTDTVEITLADRRIAFVVLRRVGGAALLGDHTPRVGTAADADELFVIGRPPKRGGVALLDHLGNELMTSANADDLEAWVSLLCDDLRSQPDFDVGIRGIAVPCEGGFEVLDERLRPVVSSADDHGGPRLLPAPLHVLGVRVGSDGPVVTARNSEPPYEHQAAPLVGLRCIDPVTGPASSVAHCATFLADPTNLAAARWLADHLKVEHATKPPASDGGRRSNAGPH